MANYIGNRFIGQRIKIDGSTFTGNVFQNCVLVYGGGSLDFSNNSLNGVRWEFVDSAARTIALLSSFYQSEGSSQKFVETLLSTFGKQIEEPKPSEEQEGDENESK
jgi:hypothetical protein